MSPAAPAKHRRRRNRNRWPHHRFRPSPRRLSAARTCRGPSRSDQFAVRCQETHSQTGGQIPEKEKGEWRRKVELGINTAQGNSETLSCDASASVAKETEETSYLLKAGGRYGKSDGDKDTENAMAEAKIQRRLTERLYTVAEANIYHDQIADLAYRARGSVALGCHVVRSERMLLSAEAGPGYIAEKKGGLNEGFIAGRVGQYFDFLATPSLQLWESIEYVPSLEDSRVYFINAEIGLESVLAPNLSLRCVVENRWTAHRPRTRNATTCSPPLLWSGSFSSAAARIHGPRGCEARSLKKRVRPPGTAADWWQGPYS